MGAEERRARERNIWREADTAPRPLRRSTTILLPTQIIGSVRKMKTSSQFSCGMHDISLFPQAFPGQHTVNQMDSGNQAGYVITGKLEKLTGQIGTGMDIFKFFPWQSEGISLLFQDQQLVDQTFGVTQVKQYRGICLCLEIAGNRSLGLLKTLVSDGPIGMLPRTIQLKCLRYPDPCYTTI